MKRRIAEIEADLQAIDIQVQRLFQQRDHLEAERAALLDTSEIIIVEDFIPTPAFSHTTLPYAPAASTSARSLSSEVNPPTAPSSLDARIHELALEYWKIPEFRPLQLDIIRTTLSNRDVVGILSTGAGKSLCFQLPALLGKGVSIVISPLLSLIYDQVEDLMERRINACALTGSTPKDEGFRIMKSLSPANGDNYDMPRLVYVTPEKIVKSKKFMNVLEKLHRAQRLDRIVIDEAHCCSEYGHDFRPDYKHLGVLKMTFPSVPVIALTATCPASVLPSVMKILNIKMNSTAIYCGNLNRANLNYSVVPKPASLDDTITLMGDWIKSKYLGKSGIIYCLSKKDAETVATALDRYENGIIPCAMYHAAISTSDKESIHRKWKRGQIKVVVATIAFGMGINHPNVRFVIHHSLSKSLEGYYQEAGRAGRDGEKADCMILYRGIDAARLSNIVYGETEGMIKIQGMLKFCNTVDICRRKMFQMYFDESSSRSRSNNVVLGGWQSIDCNEFCDVCQSAPREKSDISVHVYALGKILGRFADKKLSLTRLINAYKGRASGLDAEMKHLLAELKAEDQHSDPLFLFPVAKKFPDVELERIIVHLILFEYLKEEYTCTAFARNGHLTLSRSFVRWMKKCRDAGRLLPNEGDVFWLGLGDLPVEKLKELKPKKGKKRPAAEVEHDVASDLEQDDNDDDDDVVILDKKSTGPQTPVEILESQADDFYPIDVMEQDEVSAVSRSNSGALLECEYVEDETDWEYEI